MDSKIRRFKTDNW